MKTKKLIQDNSIQNPVITVVPDEYFEEVRNSKPFQKKLEMANEMLKKYGLPKEKPKE
jgi:hypothetical protein